MASMGAHNMEALNSKQAVDLDDSNGPPIVYALGSNSSGQLGIGHTDDIDAPQRCVFRASTSTTAEHHARQVEKIVAGGNHTLLLASSGHIFATGKFNLRLHDGRISSRVFEEITPLIEHFGEITDIAASWEGSFVVFDRKVIVAWGAGTNGELGLGEGVTSTDGKAKVVLDLRGRNGSEDVEILSIKALISHVVVLCSTGWAYGWGACRKGQLGERFTSAKTLWRPKRIDSDPDGHTSLPFAPTTAVLGRDYTVFCKADQRLILWGRKPGKGTDNHVLEQAMTDGCLVISGWTTLYVSSDTLRSGHLKSVGRSTVPQNLPPLRALAAGSEHCVGVSTDGMVVAWGWNEHGNCGTVVDEKIRSLASAEGGWNKILLPSNGQVLEPFDVAAGCATTFIICSIKKTA
jgi:protein ATS1